MEKFFKHGIPGTFQPFIQRKNAKRSAARTSKGRPVKVDVQKKAVHIPGCKRQAGPGEQSFYVVRGEPEYNMKAKRIVFSFRKFIKKRADAPPERISAVFHGEEF